MADFNVPSLNVSLMDGGLIVLDQISVVVNKPSMEYKKKSFKYQHLQNIFNPHKTSELLFGMFLLAICD